MRATLIALIGALTLTACAPDREAPANSLVERGGLVYEVNSDDPFAGLAVSYHENGQLQAKVAMKGGQIDGPLEIYYENGQLQAKVALVPIDGRSVWGDVVEVINMRGTNRQLMLYDDRHGDGYGGLEVSGPFDGPVEAYQENGLPQIKFSYKDGQLDGSAEIYYNNGQLREITTYKDGQMHGPSESYYENGQLRGKGDYKEDQPDGTFESYHANGQLQEKGDYKDGQLHGTQETYFENGQLQEKAAYKNGQRDGPAETYHPNGQLREEATYKDGERDGAYETYHSNGQLREKGSHKDGQRDGPFESYSEDGQPREKKTYANGQLNGTSESYGSNGQLREKKTYKTGQVDGPYESYYANGQLREKGTRKGEQSWDGAYESYHENGRPREKKTYRGGKLDGAYETYHANGQLRRKENYKGGDRDGPAQNYDENGQLLKLDLPVMAGIPAGSFRMGCVSGRSCRNDERPVHTVTISQPFALSKHEVTFSQWETCVLMGGCNGYRPADEGLGRGDHPVINVSWQDAQSYVSWLSQETGEDYRLPSEAEWEFAARAGSTTQYRWGNEVGRNNANCDGCGSRWDDQSTAPVGSFPANAYGLHDMQGNVFEWVEDCWNSRYTGAPSNGSAWLNGNCRSRVTRGGSWRNSPRYLRSATRARSAPDARGNNGGFRVAMTRTP